MNKENIVEVDAEEERVEELMESHSVSLGGTEGKLSDFAGDIQHAHKELDEYKQGSLRLSQDLSEAAKDAEGETLTAILTDMSNGAFGVYLRLHRGDMELLGGREGEYSDFLSE